MHLVTATATLRPGVTDADLLAASARFQDEVLRPLGGAVVSRVLTRGTDGAWTDVVLLRDAAAIEAVMAAEQASPAFAELAGMLEMQGEPRVLEVVQSL